MKNLIALELEVYEKLKKDSQKFEPLMKLEPQIKMESQIKSEMRTTSSFIL